MSDPITATISRMALPLSSSRSPFAPLSLKVMIAVRIMVVRLAARLAVRLLHFSAYRDLGDPEGRLGVAHRRTLPVLAAGSDGKPEVRADEVDGLKDRRAVPHERRAAHRLADPAVLDKVAFAHFEHKVAVDRVHLAAAHLPDIEALRGGPQDIRGTRLSRENHRVRHAGNGPMAVGLPPAVAGRACAVLQGSEPVV